MDICDIANVNSLKQCEHTFLNDIRPSHLDKHRSGVSPLGKHNIAPCLPTTVFSTSCRRISVHFVTHTLSGCTYIASANVWNFSLICCVMIIYSQKISEHVCKNKFNYCVVGGGDYFRYVFYHWILNVC